MIIKTKVRQLTIDLIAKAGLAVKDDILNSPRSQADLADIENNKKIFVVQCGLLNGDLSNLNAATLDFDLEILIAASGVEIAKIEKDTETVLDQIIQNSAAFGKIGASFTGFSNDIGFHSGETHGANRARNIQILVSEIKLNIKCNSVDFGKSDFNDQPDFIGKIEADIAPANGNIDSTITIGKME